MIANQNDPTRPTVARLAPSPTGGLHLGHARTFLAAWLFARQAHGRVVLRIEDIDATRARPGVDQEMMTDLRWIGLDWDEGPDVGGPHAPYHQSLRLDHYRASLEALKARELVYPCTCTRADIQRAASAPHEGDEGPRYPGTCAHRSVSDANALAHQPFAWRFRTTSDNQEWDDRFRGPSSLAVSGGDFVVAKSPGPVPSYQFAVVHDDAAMNVTEVLRGDDLVASTPRQLLLYRALGWPPPRFGHLPLVLGPDGRRLAKRDGSIKLAALRTAGVSPRSLSRWLARSLGIATRDDAEGPVDWAGRFDLQRVPRTPWVVTNEALNALYAQG